MAGVVENGSTRSTGALEAGALKGAALEVGTAPVVEVEVVDAVMGGGGMEGGGMVVLLAPVGAVMKSGMACGARPAGLRALLSCMLSRRRRL